MFVISYSRGKSSYAMSLGTLSLSIQVYLLGYLMEINMSQLDQLVFWNQVQYFGIPFFPALWLLVSILYTERDKKLTRTGWFLIFIVPCLTFIARLTNSLHGLYYTDMQVKTTNGVTLMFLSKGPWYVVQMLYVLVALVMCSWFYYKRFRSSEGYDRKPFRLLLIASILPYLSLILVALNMGGTGIDFTAVILPPCVYLINIALTRYNFMEIKALARERVFINSELGFVILDKNDFVVDYNNTSLKLFKWLDIDLKHISLNALLKDHPTFLNDIMTLREFTLTANDQGQRKFIDLHIQNIQGHNQVAGRLMTLSDVTEKEQLRERLVSMANTDVLSGLSTRRHFNECASEIFSRAKRYNETFSVLMMDIDYFKRINDSYGHQAGDEVIRRFANLLLSTFRDSDIVGRMGGEEFAVIMLNSSRETAFQKSEEFRQIVEHTKMTFESQEFHITVSIGLVEMTPSTASFDTLLNKADHLLYEAKEKGRNRTMC